MNFEDEPKKLPGISKSLKQPTLREQNAKEFT
jgi:hypothetical protein